MMEQAPSQDLALAINTQKLNLWYGTFQALFDIDLDIKQGIITSMIGPSGCGKSTFLRSVNRINERLGYVRITGEINVMGENIYDPAVELVEANVRDIESLRKACAGCSAAYYLVHSMDPGQHDFSSADRQGAENMARTAELEGLSRLEAKARAAHRRDRPDSGPAGRWTTASR